MKTFALISALLLSATPAMAQQQVLAGVSDEETAIPAGGIRDYQQGDGDDVLFVRHASDRWYRVQVTDGCLRQLRSFDGLAFATNTPGGRIDRFTRVVQPAYNASCRVESIRRSEAPPQVDSQSSVTGD